MINYIVYIVIILILFLISVIAIKAINRGIKAKQKLNKQHDYEKYKSTILRAELIMLYANVLIILCFIYRSTTTTGNQ